LRLRIILFFVLGFFILLQSSISIETKAIPEFARDVPQGLKNNCNVCHEKASGGPINDFGRDYAAYNRNMDMIREIDSDGDGFTNGDELDAGTLPGFSNSFPNKKSGLDLRLVFALIVTLGVVLILGGRTLRK
jgi:hypothetical protein